MGAAEGRARQIKRVFGKVRVNFGEPLPLAEFLERSRPGWASEDLSDAEKWSREVTQGAAIELAQRITPPSSSIRLIWSRWPCSRRRGTPVDEQVLDRMLATIRALITEAPYSRRSFRAHSSHGRS